MSIIKAQSHDLPAIVEIYNWAILNTSATFDTEIKTNSEQTPWFEKFNETYPLFVFKESNLIKGWASLSPVSDRLAYEGSGEIAIYIAPDFQKKGIGKALLSRLIEHGKEYQFRTLISKISCEALASIHLHQKLGFIETGTLKKVGKKFGKVLDVHLYQHFLDQ
jgi:phosphinothricin acetyltransferase